MIPASRADDRLVAFLRGGPPPLDPAAPVHDPDPASTRIVAFLTGQAPPPPPDRGLEGELPAEVFEFGDVSFDGEPVSLTLATALAAGMGRDLYSFGAFATEDGTPIQGFLWLYCGSLTFDEAHRGGDGTVDFVVLQDTQPIVGKGLVVKPGWGGYTLVHRITGHRTLHWRETTSTTHTVGGYVVGHGLGGTGTVEPPGGGDDTEDPDPGHAVSENLTFNAHELTTSYELEIWTVDHIITAVSPEDGASGIATLDSVLTIPATLDKRAWGVYYPYGPPAPSTTGGTVMFNNVIPAFIYEAGGDSIAEGVAAAVANVVYDPPTNIQNMMDLWEGGWVAAPTAVTLGRGVLAARTAMTNLDYEITYGAASYQLQRLGVILPAIPMAIGDGPRTQP